MAFKYYSNKDCKDDKYITKMYCESFDEGNGCKKIGYCKIYKELK